MAKPILSDELWAAIEPLLPVHQPSAKGGRPRLSDRAALTGILYVLYTGPRWPPQTAPLMASQTAPGRTLQIMTIPA